MTMTLAAQIVTALVAKGIPWPGGPTNALIHRTRAGRHQRACGAWSWTLKPLQWGDASYPDVGSQDPASEIAKGFVATWSKAFHSYTLDINPTGALKDELEGS